MVPSPFSEARRPILLGWRRQVFVSRPASAFRLELTSNSWKRIDSVLSFRWNSVENR